MISGSMPLIGTSSCQRQRSGFVVEGPRFWEQANERSRRGVVSPNLYVHLGYLS